MLDLVCYTVYHMGIILSGGLYQSGSLSWGEYIGLISSRRLFVGTLFRSYQLGPVLWDTMQGAFVGTL